jgi:hypothetical protein
MAAAQVQIFKQHSQINMALLQKWFNAAVTGFSLRFLSGLMFSALKIGVFFSAKRRRCSVSAEKSQFYQEFRHINSGYSDSQKYSCNKAGK